MIIPITLKPWHCNGHHKCPSDKCVVCLLGRYRLWEHRIVVQGCTGYVPCHHNVLCKKSADCFVVGLLIGFIDFGSRTIQDFQYVFGIRYHFFGLFVLIWFFSGFIDHSDIGWFLIFDGYMKEQSNIHIIDIYR